LPFSSSRLKRWSATSIAAVVAILAVAIAAYASTYLIFHERVFPPLLKDSFQARPWGIYPHVLFGAIALVVGPIQFRRGILARHRRVHRVFGTIYVLASLMTGVAGLYMAFFAFGGVVTQAGFGALALALLTTTSLAYVNIRRRDIAAHREWMLRSYALIFAAVTLRLELPFLQVWLHGFAPAYAVVAWLSWVPNILWAEMHVRMTRRIQTPIVQRLQTA
jgi:uncharacterized membrane protein